MTTGTGSTVPYGAWVTCPDGHHIGYAAIGLSFRDANWSKQLSWPKTTGIVASISLDEGGTGYSEPPTVTIGPPAYGEQATATALVAEGAVTGFTVTEQGSGYISAPAVFIGGPGTGAAGSAIFALRDIPQPAPPLRDGSGERRCIQCGKLWFRQAGGKAVVNWTSEPPEE